MNPSPLWQQLKPVLNQMNFAQVWQICLPYIKQGMAEALFWAGVAADQLEQEVLSAQVLQAAYLQHQSWVIDYHETWDTRPLLKRYCQKACYNTGVYFQQHNQTERALYFYQQALIFDEYCPEAWYNSGLILQAQQQWVRALRAFEKAWEEHPHFEQAGLALGRLYLQRQESARAVVVFQTLRQHHDSVAIQLGLVQALTQNQQSQQAEPVVAALLQEYPHEAVVHNQVGLWWESQSQWEQAHRHYQRALQLQPQLAEAWHNLAHLAHQQGHWQAADQAYQQALQIQPTYSPAHYNLGLLHAWLNQFEQACWHWQQVLVLAPWESDTYRHLASVLLAQNRATEAQQLLEQALLLGDKQAEIYYGMGQMFFYRKQFVECHAAFKKAAQLRPQDPLYRLQTALTEVFPPLTWEQEEALPQHLWLIMQHFQPGEFNVSHWGDQLVQNQLLTLFEMVYYPMDIAMFKRRYAQLFQPVLNPTPKRRSAPPFRLGFLVTFSHSRIFMSLMQGILQHLDRQRFELVVFCSPADAGWIKQQWLGPEPEWHWLPSSWQGAVNYIRNTHLDLLYFWEVGTDPLNYWLAFVRLAPIQITSWGSVTTTGVPTIDYFISSRGMEEPDAQQQYSEQLVTLSRLPACFTLPPKKASFFESRTELEWPEQAHVYLCPHNFLKMARPFGELVRGILAADPQGIWVIMGDQEGYAYQLLRSRMATVWDEFASRIVVMAPLVKDDYLNVLREADVLLDTSSYGGGNVSYEAISLGCPLVTWPGSAMCSRITAALYQQMGFTTLIARSAATYIQLAVRLACDPEWRAEQITQMNALKHRVVDDRDVVTEFGNWCWQVLTE